VEVLAGKAPVVMTPLPSQAKPKKPVKNWRDHLRGLLPYVDDAKAAALGWYAPDGDSPAAAYLRRRGIDPMLPVLCGVRYHPAWSTFRVPAVVFPLRGRNGELVAAEGRYLAIDAKGQKVRTEGTKGDGVFMTIEPFCQDTIIIVESPINALSLAVCGLPGVIATCGAGNYPAWLADACHGKQVWIGFDNDATGDGSGEKLAAMLAKSGIRARKLKPAAPGMDWNEALLTYGRTALSEACKRLNTPPNRTEGP